VDYRKHLYNRTFLGRLSTSGTLWDCNDENREFAAGFAVSLSGLTGCAVSNLPQPGDLKWFVEQKGSRKEQAYVARGQ
jgi:hypothetical protein